MKQDPEVNPIHTSSQTLHIVPATLDHARALKLRACDLQEVNLASPGADPLALLQLAVTTGGPTYAAVEDGGEVVALGGFSASTHMVSPWLLAADSLQRHSKQLMRHARAFLEGMQRDFPGRLVGNYVSRGNEPARAFLEALGATIVPTPGKADFDLFLLPSGREHMAA